MMKLRWLIVLALLMIAGCPASNEGTSSEEQQPTTQTSSSVAEESAAENLIVWADPSLKLPLEGIEGKFKAVYKVGYQVESKERGEIFEFAYSMPDELPDVFIVADHEQLTALRNKEMIEDDLSRCMAGDRLVVVENPGRGYKTATLFDIYRLRFDALALGTPDTSVGHYAEQALISDGCFDRVKDRLMTIESSEDISSKVVNDDAQLGIVYASTVVQDPTVEIIYMIKEDLHEDIRYYAVPSKGNKDKEKVIDLLMFFSENEAVQELLTGYGLVDRTEAIKEDK